MYRFAVDIAGGTRISRRCALRAALVAGAGSAAGAFGDKAMAAARTSRSDTAVIQIWLGGGPSHLDMYDLKPEAPAEYRGEFRPIATCVPGLEICELLPLSARMMDRLSVIRSLHHTTSEHPAGAHWMLTGHYAPLGVDGQPTRPAAGAIAARVRGPTKLGMAPYLHIAPDPMGFPVFIRCHESAYLGARAAPLVIESSRAVADMNRATLDNLIGKVQFEVPSLGLAPGLDADRLATRADLSRRLDHLKPLAAANPRLAELDEFHDQALDLMASGAAGAAFELSREPQRVRDLYGMNAWGQGLLLCRRLVEAGAAWVTLNTDSFSGQWDNHGNLAGQFREMLPVYDRMLAALLDDLCDRGLFQRVVVLVCGEFGRTPRINGAAGRDHWGMAGFALLGGGGLRGGVVVGTTTSKGEEPKDRPVRPGDLLATVYHALGIDTETEFPDAFGRPIKVLAEGARLAELV